MKERDDLSEKLQRALSECARLRKENDRLKVLLGIQQDNIESLQNHDLHTLPPTASPAPEVFSKTLLPEAKVALLKSSLMSLKKRNLVRFDLTK